jgi:hypothetical protein
LGSVSAVDASIGPVQRAAFIAARICSTSAFAGHGITQANTAAMIIETIFIQHPFTS